MNSGYGYNQDQQVPFTFPFSGNYREELHGLDNLINVNTTQEYWLSIPSNYGRIWSLDKV
ncbi:MAG: hypothetical protein J7M03_01290 [Candidatus Desulfofervidaceae bacterium]|nr:hypothetical protein [Candidatus Desulfofervidaceae bacterium]MDL1969571.1 hypothetical protein [Candidatus Desulfofervidaceae bacterium]